MTMQCILLILSRDIDSRLWQRITMVRKSLHSFQFFPGSNKEWQWWTWTGQRSPCGRWLRSGRTARWSSRTLTDTYFNQNQEVQPNISISPQVVCVRYWVALGILSVAALSSDSLPKFFPGYFLAKGLLLLWTVYSKQPGTWGASPSLKSSCFSPVCSNFDGSCHILWMCLS